MIEVMTPFWNDHPLHAHSEVSLLQPQYFANHDAVAHVQRTWCIVPPERQGTSRVRQQLSELLFCMESQLSDSSTRTANPQRAEVQAAALGLAELQIPGVCRLRSFD